VFDKKLGISLQISRQKRMELVEKNPPPRDMISSTPIDDFDDPVLSL
jgi:hypothetical protein